MEKITFKGTPVHTYGKLPKVGSQAPCFTLTRSDLTELYWPVQSWSLTKMEKSFTPNLSPKSHKNPTMKPL